MATDPAVIGWLGQAVAHHLHSWAGRAGAVFVVGLGLLLVRRHRPLQPDEIMAAIGLLVWIGGDIVIEATVPVTEVLKLWSARGAIALVLAIGYKLARNRRQVGLRSPG